MNFEKIKMQKFLKLAPTCCPTVTVQSKQLLLCGTANPGGTCFMRTDAVIEGAAECHCDDPTEPCRAVHEIE